MSDIRGDALEKDKVNTIARTHEAEVDDVAQHRQPPPVLDV